VLPSKIKVFLSKNNKIIPDKRFSKSKFGDILDLAFYKLKI
jgi:hypothetical protein